MGEQAQHIAHLLEYAARKGGCGFGQSARLVDEAVDAAREVEEIPQGTRGVEVIVHRFGELGAEGSGLLLHPLAPATRILPAASREPEPHVVEPVQPFPRLTHHLIRIIHRVPVVRPQQEIADHLGGVVFQNRLDGEEVALRFAHLLVVDLHEAVVHPVAHPLVPETALALRNLVFMVGEHQILTPAVDVETIAQISARHDGALDVPAGTARPPGTLPFGLAGLRRLPEGEVERVALALARFDAVAGFEFLGVAARELAVVCEFLDVVVDVPLNLVGDSLLDEFFDHLDHALDVLRGARGDVRPPNAERIHVGVVFADELLGQLIDGNLETPGAGDDLVVHVREVAHEENIVAAVFEIAVNHVENDGGARVAEMAVVVHRHPAHIHLHAAFFQGHEGFFHLRQSVV